MKRAIQCKYSCFKCGIVRKVVTVPEREQEGVVEWVNATALLLGADHDRTSPNCRITKLDEVMIPLTDGSGKIGGASPG